MQAVVATAVAALWSLHLAWQWRLPYGSQSGTNRLAGGGCGICHGLASRSVHGHGGIAGVTYSEHTYITYIVRQFRAVKSPGAMSSTALFLWHTAC
jgi:hypothetical protein